MSEQEEKALKTNKILLATGFTAMFSDSLNNRFNNLLVTTAGATVNQLGFLQGAKSLGANLLQLLFGRLIDRYGKRKFIAAGSVLNAIAIAGLIVFETPDWLIWMVILSSFTRSMTMPSWQSLVGDYTTDRNRGEIIGRVNSVRQAAS